MEERPTTEKTYAQKVMECRFPAIESPDPFLAMPQFSEPPACDKKLSGLRGALIPWRRSTVAERHRQGLMPEGRMVGGRRLWLLSEIDQLREAIIDGSQGELEALRKADRAAFEALGSDWFERIAAIRARREEHASSAA